MTALTPIRVVADHFEVAVSTLHYWERRGLITSHRRAGKRCYDTDQLYRIALIKEWRTSGLFGLEQIALMLNGPGWLDGVAARIEEIERQQEQLANARAYLDRLLGCRSPGDPERCPGFRAETELPAPC
ncbi:DNA-binding transcriptional regulator, MerR family [Saccharopolyspora antimicrobica]|uniref:DNA-binding transcriptional MerR regulator n=1 Tax=Saccharopolyspora antimicrobica TaxID=455193 RepID=A0A1I5A2B3_9PSEU|nr:MerR family transcriptional regulator [Saccharopolyspora antimicrobica]RKT83301.1 DNA-binding transcriptional MerR regulator [Saccharopolyspora antimicrobica]SFN56632.1 DNA-binding transcriptional regulator, MerR family [Saccharopolyspora antimicrobica]